MPIWLIEPVARPDDPVWQDGPQWERVVVRAATSAMARVAAEWLDAALEVPKGGRMDELYGKSRFASEKAYRVTGVDDARFGDDAGPDQVLEALPRDTA